MCDKTNLFIKKAIEIYGDKYDYSEVIYVKNRDKVKIKCIDHDKIFYQSPIKHLYGVGCPDCIKIKRNANSKKLSKEQFIEKSKLVHGDSYLYDDVVYKKNSIKVKIFCKAHDKIFWQSPMGHMAGRGCKQCGIDRTINHRKITLEEFIERSNNKHNNKYNYSKVVLGDDNEKTKVNIICPVHGEFSQSVYGHLFGGGCSKCSKLNLSKGEQNIYNYLKANNISFKQQFKDDDCKYKGLLRFDFCIFIDSKMALIEFNGEQHYKETVYFNKKSKPKDQFIIQQTRDKIKVDFCLAKNIPLLVIKYTDIKNIDSILDEFINTFKRVYI